MFLTLANDKSNYFTPGKVYRACCAIKPSMAVLLWKLISRRPLHGYRAALLKI